MTNPRLISLAHLSALSCNPPELVTIAANAGFLGVGLRLNASLLTETPFPMLGNSAMRRETKDRLAETGLVVNDVEVLCIYPDTQPNDFLGLFEATADLGAHHVLVNGEDPDETRFAECFGALCDLAAPFGLSLGLEFMRYRALASLGQTQRAIEIAKRSNSSLVIDTLHFFRAEHSIADLADIDPAKISFVQLSDAPAKAPSLDKLAGEARGDRLVPGAGDLPLKGFLQAIPDVPISVEVPTSGNATPSEHAHAAFAATKLLLASSESAALH